MDCIAHRGAANRVPENSIAGVHYVATHGIKQIECDISVASDDVAVIFHDESLRRMTGDPRSLLAIPSQQLTQIPLISHHICPTQYIPTARQWMDEVAKVDLFAHLEIKVHDQEVERAVDATLTAFSESDLTLEQVRFSSFSIDAMQLVRERQPNVEMGLAATRWSDISNYSLESLGLTSIHLDIECLQNDDVHAIVERGFAVAAYTVNQVSDYRDLPISSIKAAFTDDPVALMAQLNTLKNSN